jgi:hypothetical protein
MASEAAATLVGSAAPGQFDLVAENVQKLGAKTLSGTAWLDDLKQGQLEFTLANNNKNAGVSHPLAEPLKAKLEAYQEKIFNNKVSSRVSFAPGDSPAQLIVTTYAEKLDLPNQYTGFWKSTWTIEAASESEADIAGDVQLHTLSYEDGNTQLKSQKVFEVVTVGKKAGEGDDGPNLAEGVFRQIVDWEHEVLGILASLQDLSSEHLRHIRRVLPITKTKMKWEVAVQRGVKHLKKTAKR